MTGLLISGVALGFQPRDRRPERPALQGREAGFSLPELLVATTILLIVSSVVTAALVQMSNSQKTIWNRTEMASAVRGATELLQQEVGQAGSIALPGSVTLTGAAAGTGSAAVSVSSVTGMFVGELLTIDAGSSQETIAVTALNSGTSQLTAVFTTAHAAGDTVAVFGGFPSGIVPTTTTNGSTASVLKLYGDINSDGSMVYVEYTCDTSAGVLYRNTMAFNAASKPVAGAAQRLLGNVLANPGGTACFTYQTKTVAPDTYVTNVGITLTGQTEQKDPITNQYQTESKALLNVSPRNIVNVAQLATSGITNRVQAMPASVAALLP